MKRKIGAIAGTAVVAAVTVCMVLTSGGPAVAASISANDVSVINRSGKVTTVNVDVWADITWSNFDTIPDAAIEIYFGPVASDGTVTYARANYCTVIDDFVINATSGSDEIAFGDMDLTDSTMWSRTVPAVEWSNDEYFSTSGDGTTKVTEMSVKLEIAMYDEKTTVTRVASDLFTITVQNTSANVDYTAQVDVSVS